MPRFLAPSRGGMKGFFLTTGGAGFVVFSFLGSSGGVTTCTGYCIEGALFWLTRFITSISSIVLPFAYTKVDIPRFFAPRRGGMKGFFFACSDCFTVGSGLSYNVVT